MNLRKQLQQILDDSSEFGISPLVIEKAVIPGLVKLAKPLKHSSYYLWLNRQEQFVITVLANRTNSNVEKKVIYAFPNIAIAQKFPGFDPNTMVITEVAVTHLLFEAFGFTSETLDGVIFAHQQGNNYQFQSVECQEIKRVIQEKIEKLKGLIDTPPSNPRLA